MKKKFNYAILSKEYYSNRINDTRTITVNLFVLDKISLKNKTIDSSKLYKTIQVDTKIDTQLVDILFMFSINGYIYELIDKTICDSFY